MSDIWKLLGIACTQDRKAIRRAFAAQARLHHPEEEPEYFAGLNDAYKRALAYADDALKAEPVSNAEMVSNIFSASDENSIKDIENISHTNTESVSKEKMAEPASSLLDRLDAAETRNIQQSLQKGALHKFITLFENTKQAKQADTWKRFFLSEDFLGEQYQEEFGKGLFIYLREQNVCPYDNLPMGLLQELAIAYAFTPHFAGEEYFEGKIYPKEWYKVSVEDTFPARKYTAEIFNMQGRECDLKSMTRHIFRQPANKVRHNSFADYLALKEMNRNGQLTEQEGKSWQKLLRFAKVHHLYERNGKSASDPDGEARSVCLVPLYVQWLKDERVPECVLKFIYRELAFKELDRSSTRGLYEALKEQVLRQLPGIEELLFSVEGKEQMIVKLYKACSRIFNSHHSNYEKSIYGETPEIKEQAREFFAMPEWDRLKKDRDLFEKLYTTAKRLVMPRSMAEGLIKYLEEGDFPEPKRSLLMEALLKSLRTEQMCRELDYRYAPAFDNTDISDISGDNGEFWHYYFMRGFGCRHARLWGTRVEEMIYELDGEAYLPAYIKYIYEPSRTWQKLFTGFDQEAEAIASPVSAVCNMPDGRALRVEFHYHYCQYFVDEAQVISPVLSFQELKEYQEKIGKPEEFFFLLAVTAIEKEEKAQAQGMIEEWLAKTPLYPFIRQAVAKLLAADNDRIPMDEAGQNAAMDTPAAGCAEPDPEGLKGAGERKDTAAVYSVYYDEQERFCFRAVVSGASVRIFRQIDFGWEDEIFIKKEFGWKEVTLPSGLRNTLAGLAQAGFEEKEKAALEILQALRHPMPIKRAAWELDGMDAAQKAEAVLKALGYPENPEGYCVLRCGDKRERRHDRLFYGAAAPFGFNIGEHSGRYESSVQYSMNAARTKIKEPITLAGRFGWGAKYSPKSDFAPCCVCLGESGTYYAYGLTRIYRADTLVELLAKLFQDEFAGVTGAEAYEGCLTISRLDRRLEYCYREEDFLESVHTAGNTGVDNAAIFGRYTLWKEFAGWMDTALEKGLPSWVNAVVLGINWKAGSTLTFAGIWEEEITDTAFGSPEDLYLQAPGQEEREAYLPDLPVLAWKCGAGIRERENTLYEAVEWYMNCGAYADALKGYSVRVCVDFEKGVKL